MEKIRFLLFVVGSVLFGLGMTLAGLVNISKNRFAAGVAYIVLAAVMIVFLTVVFRQIARGKKG